jgi:hypothetical protein
MAAGKIGIPRTLPSTVISTVDHPLGSLSLTSLTATKVREGSPVGWGGGAIEYPSPYATAWRKRRPEGAPRGHIECAVVRFLKTAYVINACAHVQEHRQHSVSHRIYD